MKLSVSQQDGHILLAAPGHALALTSQQARNLAVSLLYHADDVDGTEVLTQRLMERLVDGERWRNVG